jgi:hypothetical protein
LCGDTWSWTRVTDSTTSQSEHRLFWWSRLSSSSFSQSMLIPSSTIRWTWLTNIIGAWRTPCSLNMSKGFCTWLCCAELKDSPEVGLSIPPKTETVLSVRLPEFQRSLYLRILTRIASLLSWVKQPLICER